ncbi:TrAP [Polygala garcinii associated virus]|uniref:Transcriptional activator protein n=1 Tax=Polygala garcinii associated virus TaxID=2093274 RepID=A0A2I8B2K6_9GEMI|nr:TrAP [Polygala garcinii associated virus]AUT11873.1 TrAP [Polygala garcinii associated virus]
MQSSSSYPNHCTQDVKIAHKAAKKKKIIRRKRIDLDCGCTIYVHIDCHNHGFTHRGTHHCTSRKEWRFYLDGTKRPLFQDNPTRHQTSPVGHGYHTPPNQVQPQPEESVGDAQVLPQFSHLDPPTASDIAFLEGL